MDQSVQQEKQENLSVRTNIYWWQAAPRTNTIHGEPLATTSVERRLIASSFRAAIQYSTMIQEVGDGKGRPIGRPIYELPPTCGGTHRVTFTKDAVLHYSVSCAPMMLVHVSLQFDLAMRECKRYVRNYHPIIFISSHHYNVLRAEG